jgi:ribosomal protein S1
MKHKREYEGWRLENIESAQDKGFISLTMTYKVFSPWEETRVRDKVFLDNTIRDMVGPPRANFCLVEVHGGIEVWRHRSEINMYLNHELIAIR